MEVHTSFSSAHAASLDDGMDFPDGMGRRDPMNDDEPERIMAEPMAESDRSYADDVAPLPMSNGSERHHHNDHVAEVVSLDSMRAAVVTNMAGNFEADDLDVPAFMRKRSEVM